MNSLTRLTARPSRLALSWLVATVAVVAVAGATCLVLSTLVDGGGRRALSVAFLTSTALLVVISWQLFRAEQYALHERQRSLHRALGVSLAAAILFLALQAAALSELLRSLLPDNSAIDPAAIVFVGVALHALHATAAVFGLVYVTLRGLAGGYDHEYRFGLTTCGWFWHALGVIWLAVLFAFTVAL